MTFLEFCELMLGFIIEPQQTAEDYLNRERSLRFSLMFMFYLSVVLGLVFWFFIGYPEPLYYGVSGAEFQSDMPALLIANPWLYLLALLAISIILQFIINFLILGHINFRIMKCLTRERRNSEAIAKEYLSLFAFSFLPLLFIVPVLTFWDYFLENLMFMKPIFPFFDLTVPNIILLTIFAGFFLWKLFLEVIINKIYFSTSVKKSIVPILFEIGIIVFLLLSLFLITNLFSDEIIGGFGA